MKSTPFLRASLVVAGLGYLWVFLVLSRNYPWLLWLLFFLGSSAAFFFVAAVLLFLHVFASSTGGDSGVLLYIPAQLADLLSRPLYEILHLGCIRIMLPICDWLRLLLLAFTNLDEEERYQVLNEMDDTFRQNVFQRPALRLLPEFVQRVLLGGRWQPQPDQPGKLPARSSSLPEEQLAVAADRAANFEGDVKPSLPRSKTTALDAPRRRGQGSVADVLDVIRSVEGAVDSTRGSGILQKVLVERISDTATEAFKQGAAHTYEAQLSDAVHQAVSTVQAAHETITTPPSRMLYRVPWEAARVGIRVSTALASTVFGSVEVPEQQGTVKKRQ